jgi:hypothetical protein
MLCLSGDVNNKLEPLYAEIINQVRADLAETGREERA